MNYRQRQNIYDILLAGVVLGLLVVALVLYFKADDLEQSTPSGTSIAEATQVTIDNKPALGEAVACIKIGETFPFNEMQEDGYLIDYSENVWKINGEPVGVAKAEDEPFYACGSPDLIATLEGYSNE